MKLFSKNNLNESIRLINNEKKFKKYKKKLKNKQIEKNSFFKNMFFKKNLTLLLFDTKMTYRFIFLNELLDFQIIVILNFF